MAEIEAEGKGMDSVEPASVPVKINKQFEGDTDNEIETRPTFINQIGRAHV